MAKATLRFAPSDGVPSAWVRDSCILGTQPPSTNETLQSAIEALRAAVSAVNAKQLLDIPDGLNQPVERAIKANSGEETYYR